MTATKQTNSERIKSAKDLLEISGAQIEAADVIDDRQGSDEVIANLVAANRNLARAVTLLLRVVESHEPQEMSEEEWEDLAHEAIAEERAERRRFFHLGRESV
jgi:hypothetical protein